MNAEQLEQIFGPAASASKTEANGLIAVKPSVVFHSPHGGEAGWNKAVDTVRVWVSEVRGEALVSKHGVVISRGINGRSNVVYCDTYGKGDDPIDEQSIELPFGTVVQAGITIEMRSGRRFVTACVGIVPEQCGLDHRRDNVAVGTSRIKTNDAQILVEGIVQLSPEDAALVSKLRHQVQVFGEDHVRAVLGLVTGEGDKVERQPFREEKIVYDAEAGRLS
ncbi:protein of unknown function [Pseudodesulfovibrio profundus]|jgi:hypothetical protein|uniref:Uncharacterized protein n=1 Tax=Pseudodesulfovibrio profundus TaxID=57320 RepID=A0A2C8F6L7_9BACT|nr:protein of unknown function [Pseudodesulfovibrio profundus]